MWKKGTSPLFPAFFLHGTWWEKAKAFHTIGGVARFPHVIQVESTEKCGKGEGFRGSGHDLLLPTVAKVGKSTGRNLRFLHLPARYAVCNLRLFTARLRKLFLIVSYDESITNIYRERAVNGRIFINAV